MKRLIKWNKKYLEISKYVILAAFVIMVLGYMVVHIPQLAGAAGGVAGWFAAILKPVFIGLVLAYLFYPLVVRLEKLLDKVSFINKKKHARLGATLILLLIVVAAVAGAVMGLILLVTRQASTLDVNSLLRAIQEMDLQVREFFGQVQKWLAELNISSEQLHSYLSGLTDTLSTKGQETANHISASISNISGMMTTMLFAAVISVYFLLDEYNLRNYWRNVVDALLPKKANQAFDQVLEDANYVFSGYIRGQALDAMFMAVLVSIVFTVAGVPYGVLIGIMTGLGNLVPYLGPVLGYGLTLMAGVVTGDYKAMLIGVICLCIIQLVDGNIVNPKLLSSSISVHPMLVVVALIAGGNIGGLMGMLVAVPCGALLKIWFDRYLDHLRKSREAEEGAGCKPVCEEILNQPIEE